MASVTGFVGKIGRALYNGVTAVPSAVLNHKVTTLCAPVIAGVSIATGMALSAVTGGRVDLNKCVPLKIRQLSYKLGRKLAAVERKISLVLARTLRTELATVGLLVSAPLVEELAFRLPLILASDGLDAAELEGLATPLFENVTDLTGKQAIKLALSLIASIGFTYAHGVNPDPGRAAHYFVGGLMCAYLALEGEGGLGNSMLAHSLTNLVPVLFTSRREAEPVLPVRNNGPVATQAEYDVDEVD